MHSVLVPSYFSYFHLVIFLHPFIFTGLRISAFASLRLLIYFFIVPFADIHIFISLHFRMPMFPSHPRSFVKKDAIDMHFDTNINKYRHRVRAQCGDSFVSGGSVINANCSLTYRPRWSVRADHRNKSRPKRRKRGSREIHARNFRQDLRRINIRPTFIGRFGVYLSRARQDELTEIARTS